MAALDDYALRAVSEHLGYRQTSSLSRCQVYLDLSENAVEALYQTCARDWTSCSRTGWAGLAAIVFVVLMAGFWACDVRYVQPDDSRLQSLVILQAGLGTPILLTLMYLFSEGPRKTALAKALKPASLDDSAKIPAEVWNCTATQEHLRALKVRGRTPRQLDLRYLQLIWESSKYPPDE